MKRFRASNVERYNAFLIKCHESVTVQPMYYFLLSKNQINYL